MSSSRSKRLRLRASGSCWLDDIGRWRMYICRNDLPFPYGDFSFANLKFESQWVTWRFPILRIHIFRLFSNISWRSSTISFTLGFPIINDDSKREIEYAKPKCRYRKTSFLKESFLWKKSLQFLVLASRRKKSIKKFYFTDDYRLSFFPRIHSS